MSRGGSRLESPLLGLAEPTWRNEHGYPVVLGGQGRSAGDVRRTLMAVMFMLIFLAGFALGLGVVLICGGGA